MSLINVIHPSFYCLMTWTKHYKFKASDLQSCSINKGVFSCKISFAITFYLYTRTITNEIINFYSKNSCRKQMIFFWQCSWILEDMPKINHKKVLFVRMLSPRMGYCQHLADVRWWHSGSSYSQLDLATRLVNLDLG